VDQSAYVSDSFHPWYRELGPTYPPWCGFTGHGVSGAAVFTPIQGAIADAVNTRVSYFVPLVGFSVVLAYTGLHWFRHGHHILRIQSEDMTVIPPGHPNEADTVQAMDTDRKQSAALTVEDISQRHIGGNSVNGSVGAVDSK